MGRAATRVGALVFFCAALTVETFYSEAVAQSLPEMQQPSLAVGEKVVGVDGNGNEITYELVEKTDDSMSWVGSDGCKWKKPPTGFAPATEWSNCNGRSGSAFVSFWGEGRPWPLKVGNSWQYDIDGGNWSDSRKCTVEGTEKVTVPLGTFDTFKVVCEEGRQTHYYNISPKLQRIVKYVRVGRGAREWSLKQVLVDGIK